MMKIFSEIKSLFLFNELLRQLILRDLKIRYRRSYLGYVWSVLNPLMLMVIMIVVFSNVFRIEIENYPLYLLSAQILCNFMIESTNMSVTSIISNATLIKKTYIPKYIFIFSKVGSSLVNLLFSLLALVLVMLYTGANFSIHLFLFPVVILQLFIFCLGFGLLLSALSVFFRDIQYLWGVFVSMWMYLTPTFYPISIIPETYQAVYKFCNPLYWYIEQFRDIVLYDRFPNVDSILIGTGYAVLSLLFGLWYFNKKQDEFILYI